MKAKGVKYIITTEMIREYLKIPPSQRLEWLQEATILSYSGLTPKRRKIWQKFRRGEL